MKEYLYNKYTCIRRLIDITLIRDRRFCFTRLYNFVVLPMYKDLQSEQLI